MLQYHENRIPNHLSKQKNNNQTKTVSLFLAMEILFEHFHRVKSQLRNWYPLIRCRSLLSQIVPICSQFDILNFFLPVYVQMFTKIVINFLKRFAKSNKTKTNALSAFKKNPINENSKCRNLFVWNYEFLSCLHHDVFKNRLNSDSEFSLGYTDTYGWPVRTAKTILSQCACYEFRILICCSR